MSVHLRTKFQISSITLNSFREGRRCNTPPPPPNTSQQTPKKPTQIKVKQAFQEISGSAFPICCFAVSVSGFFYICRPTIFAF